MFGTAKPTNAIGPQNAVITPVKMAVAKIVKMRNRLRLNPSISVDRSPKTSAFNGLIKNRVSIKAAEKIKRKTGN